MPSDEVSGQTSRKALTIQELPRSDRPRERLVDLGAHALSSAELLAILLGWGRAGRSALQVGHDVLSAAHGSLRRLAMQPTAALTATPGVGMARAVIIHAALELGRRMAAEAREDGAPVRSPRDVVAVHPREVFREAIAERAAAIILVHNHPSGDPTPSADDRLVTEQLVAAGRLLDIPVHDHVIVGRGRFVSFAEAGLL